MSQQRQRLEPKNAKDWQPPPSTGNSQGRALPFRFPKEHGSTDTLILHV